MIQSRIAIFASGNGTNAEEIFNYFKGHPSIKVVLLLSNDPNSFALQRAGKQGIPAVVFTRSQFRDSDIVLKWLQDKGVTHLVLAGFLWLIPKNLLLAYNGRIINIHPALLPKFGGKGMYGMNVHQAVKAAGEKVTGITIHSVNEKYDEGKILFQASCPVYEKDTPEEISVRVNRLEYLHYPKTVESWINES